MFGNTYMLLMLKPMYAMILHFAYCNKMFRKYISCEKQWFWFVTRTFERVGHQ